MSNRTSRFYEFGDFRFDAHKKVLWRGGETLPLPPKATDVLALLIEDHGDLVERDRILSSVWQDTFVEEGNLNNAVSALRKVLGENGIIQTVPRRGYRFTADVVEIANDESDRILVEKRTLTRTTVTAEREDSESAVHKRSRPSTGTRFLALTGLIGVVAVAVFAFWFFRGTAGNKIAATSTPKTLVILPLRSLNGSADDEDPLFALGITENLASRLGGLEQLIVRPTNSSTELARTESDPVVIGQKLGADAVLDGSYQKNSGRIRVLVRLLDVTDGSQIWSGNFDEAEGDVFKLQDSLAAQAADQLTDRLTPQQTQRLASRPTDNVEAYKLYIRGRHAWNKRTRESLRESIPYFQAAIDADPAFALAYAGMADSYVLFNDYDAAMPRESYPKAKAAALKALEIQPDLVEPRVTLAYVLATYDWNFPEAELEYKRALEMRPNYATAHQWYGEMLALLKRYPEAEAHLRRAGQLDPLVPIIQSEIGMTMYYNGRYDDVISHYSRLKQEHPAFPTSYMFLAWAYEQKGMAAESFAAEMEFWKLQKVNDEALTRMARAYENGGRPAYLQSVAEALETAARNTYVSEYRLAHIYARLRNKEKTLEWLEKGVETRSSYVVKSFVDPNFEFLREEPRFKAALRQMNLPAD